MGIDKNDSANARGTPSDAGDERDRLIHDLEVHQAELEAQNQQLREAHHEIEESRARYSDLYDFAPVAYCTFDRSGCVLEINLTGAAMLGLERSRVIGKPFAVFVAEPDRSAFRTHVNRRWSMPLGPEVVELTLVRSGKDPIIVQMVSAVGRNHGGAVVSCRSTFTDITEQKRANEALRLAIQMREDFLAVVSHDLRNPLNSVLLGSEMLQEVLAGPTRLKLEMIHQAAARMSRMLSDLLDLSSMDAGHLSMERKPESVEAILATAVAAASAGAAARMIQLETHVDEPNLIAYCDRDRILQVLMNLVGNAIKFSSSNGHVRLDARRVRDEIEFVVRDGGEGISASQLARIFDPYWQAPKTAKLGTGLGLSIARGIVEIHEGRIWAESVVRAGSSFFFTLPATPVIEWTPNTPAPRERRKSGPLSGGYPTAKLAEQPPVHRGTVLIVDDEADAQTFLTELMRNEGYEVVTAADGAEALAHLRSVATLPSLILLDLVMPNVDGWQFIEERSHDARLAQIPVVLISGQIAARQTARSLGLASYIEKPIEASRLREMLARMRDSTAFA